MSSNAVYIFLSVENVVTVMWERQRSSIYDAYDIPRIRFPIQTANVLNFFNVTIRNNATYSREVLEGHVFSEPIEIQVIKGKDGNPVPNQLVFALIYGENNKEYPFGYRLSTYGTRLKQLLNPIPGNSWKYSSSPDGK